MRSLPRSSALFVDSVAHSVLGNTRDAVPLRHGLRIRLEGKGVLRSFGHSPVSNKEPSVFIRSSKYRGDRISVSIGTGYRAVSNEKRFQKSVSEVSEIVDGSSALDLHIRDGALTNLYHIGDNNCVARGG